MNKEEEIKNEAVEDKFKTIKVELTGMSALLMNNIENVDLSSGPTARNKKYDVKVDAHTSAYFIDEDNGDETLCVPARCMYATIINGAKSFKVGMQSLATVMAGVIRIEPHRISLGTKDYEIDIQSVVIGSSRVKRARARLDEWVLKFDIVYHSDYIEPPSIKQALETSGFRVGLLDFRPQKKGPYGTFKVTKFETEDN